MIVHTARYYIYIYVYRHGVFYVRRKLLSFDETTSEFHVSYSLFLFNIPIFFSFFFFSHILTSETRSLSIIIFCFPRLRALAYINTRLFFSCIIKRSTRARPAMYWRDFRNSFAGTFKLSTSPSVSNCFQRLRNDAFTDRKLLQRIVVHGRPYNIPMSTTRHAKYSNTTAGALFLFFTTIHLHFR